MDKPKILYVDDEPINLEIFELIFEDDFDITTAESGSLGLELLKLKPEIQIVVSDMKMPEMNGLEFIKKVKNSYTKIPCFILSGYDKTNDVNNAIQTGLIQGYFTKPFNQDELKSFFFKIL